MAATAIKLAQKHLRIAAGSGEWKKETLALAVEMQGALQDSWQAFEALTHKAANTDEGEPL